MLKFFKVFVICVLFVVLFTGFAEAGVLEKARSSLTSEVLALFASCIIALLCGVFGIMFKKVTRTFKEAGEFMTTLGEALEDHRLSREELGSIIKEGREIFEVWK